MKYISELQGAANLAKSKQKPTKKNHIDISYGELVKVGVDELNDFQGDLKELSDAAYEQLSKEIKETGFAFAPHAWKNPEDSKWYLVDGHQRIKTIRRLAKDSNYTIPEIPIVAVAAKSYIEAKRRVLQAASQFGTVKEDGLFEFMKSAEIKFDDFASSFKFPEIDLKHFASTFFPESAGGLSVTEINKGDENAEWVELPKFEGGAEYTRLIFHFKNEKERELFVKKHKVKVTMIKSNQWIVHVK